MAPRQPLFPRRDLLLCACALPVVSRAAAAPQPLRLGKIEGNAAQDVCEGLVREVYRRLDIPVEVVVLPALRALRDAAAGLLDGAVARIGSVAQDMPSLLRVDVPIGVSETAAFTRRPAPEIRDLDDLKGYRVGIVRGVLSTEIVRRVVDPVAVSSMDQLVDTLASGRVDIAIAERLTGGCAVARLGQGGAIVAVPQPLQRLPLYHYLHEQHRALLPKVEACLHDLERSGELAALRRSLTERIRTACVPTR
jgi:ABC-type amino acid transport substrate-binding protein